MQKKLCVGDAVFTLVVSLDDPQRVTIKKWIVARDVNPSDKHIETRLDSKFGTTWWISADPPKCYATVEEVLAAGANHFATLGG